MPSRNTERELVNKDKTYQFSLYELLSVTMTAAVIIALNLVTRTDELTIHKGERRFVIATTEYRGWPLPAIIQAKNNGNLTIRRANLFFNFAIALALPAIAIATFRWTHRRLALQRVHHNITHYKNSGSPTEQITTRCTEDA